MSDRAENTASTTGQVDAVAVYVLAQAPQDAAGKRHRAQALADLDFLRSRVERMEEDLQHVKRKAHTWLERVEQSPRYFGLDHEYGGNVGYCDFCASLDQEEAGAWSGAQPYDVPDEMRNTL